MEEKREGGNEDRLVKEGRCWWLGGGKGKGCEGRREGGMGRKLARNEKELEEAMQVFVRLCLLVFLCVFVAPCVLCWGNETSAPQGSKIT